MFNSGRNPQSGSGSPPNSRRLQRNHHRSLRTPFTIQWAMNRFARSDSESIPEVGPSSAPAVATQGSSRSAQTARSQPPSARDYFRVGAGDPEKLQEFTSKFPNLERNVRSINPQRLLESGGFPEPEFGKRPLEMGVGSVVASVSSSSSSGRPLIRPATFHPCPGQSVFKEAAHALEGNALAPAGQEVSNEPEGDLDHGSNSDGFNSSRNLNCIQPDDPSPFLVIWDELSETSTSLGGEGAPSKSYGKEKFLGLVPMLHPNVLERVFLDAQLAYRVRVNPGVVKAKVHYWENVSDIFERIGKHVFELHISIWERPESVQDQPDGYVGKEGKDWLVRILGSLSNLKKLCFWGDLMNCNVNTDLLNLAELAHLEELSVASFILEQSVSSELVTRFAPQLQHLHLFHPNICQRSLFSKLTTLEICADPIYSQQFEPRHPIAVLGLFDAPELKKLKLNFLSVADHFIYFGNRCLYYFKNHFPKLVEFTLSISIHSYGVCIWSPLATPPEAPVDVAPFENLKRIEVPDLVQFDYEFLAKLPQLSSLVFSRSTDLPPQIAVMDHSPSGFKVSLREQIQTGRLYNSNLWKILQNLSEIWIRLDEKLEESFQRSRYEELEAAGETEFQPEVFHPLRKDILDKLYEGREIEEVKV